MGRVSIVRRLMAVATVATAVAACGGGSSDDAASGEVGAGDRLPDVEVVALEGGETSSLSDFDGPAVVNLWATWCAPCRREIPDFEAVHRARGDEVTFIGVNIGDDAGAAAAFVADVGATYQQWLDSEGYAVTELRTSAMPVTIVLDAEGRISTRHLGPMDADDLDEAIDAALAD